MVIIFKKSSEFERVRSNIEQHLYDSVFALEAGTERALYSVEQFNKAIDRYRIFYKVQIMNSSDFEITVVPTLKCTHCTISKKGKKKQMWVKHLVFLVP